MEIGYIIASHEVTEAGKNIGYFYRERPDNDEDSGWRVFSGEETQAYTDDPDNFSFYNASTIVKLDPTIAPFLSRKYPVLIERVPGTDNFVVTKST